MPRSEPYVGRRRATKTSPWSTVSAVASTTTSAIRSIPGVTAQLAILSCATVLVSVPATASASPYGDLFADPAAPATPRSVALAIAAPVGVPDVEVGELDFAVVAAKRSAKPKAVKITLVGSDTGVAAGPGSVSRSSIRVAAGTPGGLSANAKLVYSVIRSQFPQIGTIGTFRSGRTDHATGHAVDAMTSDVGLGNALSAYLQANHKALGIKYIIWRQRIWQAGSPSSGWAMMGDRGSATANHYDHVHVSVY